MSKERIPEALKEYPVLKECKDMALLKVGNRLMVYHLNFQLWIRMENSDVDRHPVGKEIGELYARNGVDYSKFTRATYHRMKRLYGKPSHEFRKADLSDVMLFVACLLLGLINLVIFCWALWLTESPAVLISLVSVAAVSSVGWMTWKRMRRFW